MSGASARQDILGALRANLAGVEAPLLDAEQNDPAAPDPFLGRASVAARSDLFETLLTGVGGRVYRCGTEEAAALLMGKLAAERGVRSLAHSDAEEVMRLVPALPPSIARMGTHASRPELLAADLGLCTAQWGIAETGTVVLASESERHRLVSLLPPISVVVLDTNRIVATLGDALAAARSSTCGVPDRALTFITGPSRTADIELTLVVGVHGPKELHVILMEKD